MRRQISNHWELGNSLFALGLLITFILVIGLVAFPLDRNLASFAVPLAIAPNLVLTPTPSATPIAQGHTTRVSVASDGTQGNGESAHSYLSTNGQYVAFDSKAGNLVSGDTNSKFDIFVHNRNTGETTRISVASDGSQANGDSVTPSISANGRFIAFDSSADNLVLDDTNSWSDIFVHDRYTGQTTRVSVASDGTEADNHSSYPSISANGRYIAFQSRAGNLVVGDDNNEEDIFVHDRLTGQTTMVSVASDGSLANGDSETPFISATGRYVAYISWAGNLVRDDTNNKQDIFVHDRQTGATTRVSISSAGTEANGHSFLPPSITANGRYVVFFSEADNLVAGDTNGVGDVFMRDRQEGGTIRLSVAPDGTEGNGVSGQPFISINGRFVTFISHATNLVDNDSNQDVGDIFVLDRLLNTLTLVSIANDGTQGNDTCYNPTVSYDGRVAAFHSFATNLVPNDTNGVKDTFIHDRGY